MRHRDFCTWGIQTGPFAARKADFVPKIFHLFTQPPIIYQSLLFPERERKEAAGATNMNMEFFQSRWNTGVSVLWAFKLDHLQLVQLILFKNFYTFLPFILGGPIHYYPRERKEGNSRSWKWEKGIHHSPKSGWDTWVSVLGAFKLDHFRPSKLILF